MFDVGLQGQALQGQTHMLLLSAYICITLQPPNRIDLEINISSEESGDITHYTSPAITHSKNA